MGSAPALSNATQHSPLPALAAKCKDFMPSSSSAWTHAPAASRTSQASRYPASAAYMRGVKPVPRCCPAAEMVAAPSGVMT
eukprot:CAMPEP_0172685730 /NCGR_PEP_ID=MMETSP1074-20121228/20448_1 /TAXON_ID=2916 /ORGANISM="Ceratium fusus, Strain PA161109" /LENGTH=80 /DNA_ID=CAMNT_0013504927 /DNA_START=155 /DNA_END=397 /DNA_ORIENTATION=+